MSPQVNDQMRTFMRDEVFTLSWNGSVQRASLYNSTAAQAGEEKAEFRQAIFQMLTSVVVPSYAQRACPEEEHLKNIELLRDYGTTKGAAILGIDGYKYGVAQKLVNLFLKYLWCMGWIEEPPHCPVDRIILSKTRLQDKPNWTHMTTPEEYLHAIGALKEEAERHGQSLAVWELLSYESP